MSSDLTGYIDSLMSRFDSLQEKIGEIAVENEELKKVLSKIYEHNKKLVKEKRTCENKS